MRRFYLANPAPKAPASKQPQRPPEDIFAFLDRDADGSMSAREFEPLKDIIPYFRANPALMEPAFCSWTGAKGGMA